MSIIDDEVVRMFPSDLVGLDNRGTNGVILGQTVLWITSIALVPVILMNNESEILGEYIT